MLFRSPFNSSLTGGEWTDSGNDYHPYTEISAKSLIYIQAEIISYNNTHVKYLFTAIAINILSIPLSDVNVSIFVNDTREYSELINLNAKGIDTNVSKIVEFVRGTVDGNFTVNATYESVLIGNNQILLIDPIDPPSALLKQGGGNVSADIYIWNSTDWISFNSTNQMDFNCVISGFPTWCQPDNQDNITSQPILTNINNGNASSIWQAMKTNTTWGTNAFL